MSLKDFRQFTPNNALVLVVTQIYNDEIPWYSFQLRCVPEDVMGALAKQPVPKGINANTVIAIAKAVCAAAGVACPIINNL